MRVTIDKAGRVVVPKRLRDALGLQANSELELALDGTALRLEPVEAATRGIDDSSGLPRLTRVEGIVLTDADIRAIRDDVAR